MEFTDLDIIYADFSVQASHTNAYGGQCFGAVIFDMPGTAVIGSDVVLTDYSARYASGTFQVVKRGDIFTINDIDYVVREGPQPASFQGDEMIVQLAKA